MSLYQTEQRQSKTTRILVYPNITFAKDLEKDSYIPVSYTHLRAHET